jgi:hypothetical protein
MMNDELLFNIDDREFRPIFDLNDWLWISPRDLRGTARGVGGKAFDLFLVTLLGVTNGKVDRFESSNVYSSIGGIGCIGGDCRCLSFVRFLLFEPSVNGTLFLINDGREHESGFSFQY